jgi:hypothetical protein
LGITLIRNGVVVDQPAEESDKGPAEDGRTYLPYANKTYNQDGTADIVTGRAFNSGIALPASGNYTRVMGNPKTEAAENPQIAALRQAKASADAALRSVQDARDQDFQRAMNQQIQNDLAVASATNLVRVGRDQSILDSEQGKQSASWVVKPTKS